MAAYTTEEMLEQLLGFLPPRYVYFEDVLAGVAAQMSAVHEKAIASMEDTTVTGAEDVWLDLVAHNRGTDRASGESNNVLKERIWNVEDALTKDAIESRVNVLLAPYSVTCEVIEYFTDTMRFVGRAYVGEARLRKKKGFTVKVPLVGSSYTHSVYPLICNEVNAIKAGGIPWHLLIDPDM